MDGTKLDGNALPTTRSVPAVAFSADTKRSLATDLTKLGVRNTVSAIRGFERLARQVRAGMNLEAACEYAVDSRLSRDVNSFRKRNKMGNKQGPRPDDHRPRISCGVAREIIAQGGRVPSWSMAGPFARILREVHHQATGRRLPNDLKDVFVDVRSVTRTTP